ncbi:hypothetical protein BC829DRAFT_395557 [Chytridium lagenaria]|nr:hypothetical protein BC829DRAFT_395557 [Chytridium lagenaria]
MTDSSPEGNERKKELEFADEDARSRPSVSGVIVNEGAICSAAVASSVDVVDPNLILSKEPSMHSIHPNISLEGNKENASTMFLGPTKLPASRCWNTGFYIDVAAAEMYMQYADDELRALRLTASNDANWAFNRIYSRKFNEAELGTKLIDQSPPFTFTPQSTTTVFSKPSHTPKVEPQESASIVKWMCNIPSPVISSALRMPTGVAEVHRVTGNTGFNFARVSKEPESPKPLLQTKVSAEELSTGMKNASVLRAYPSNVYLGAKSVKGMNFGDQNGNVKKNGTLFNLGGIVLRERQDPNIRTAKPLDYGKSCSDSIKRPPVPIRPPSKTTDLLNKESQLGQGGYGKAASSAISAVCESEKLDIDAWASVLRNHRLLQPELPTWPLSCYGDDSKPCSISGTDVSPEEARFLWWSDSNGMTGENMESLKMFKWIVIKCFDDLCNKLRPNYVATSIFKIDKPSISSFLVSKYRHMKAQAPQPEACVAMASRWNHCDVGQRTLTELFFPSSVHPSTPSEHFVIKKKTQREPLKVHLKKKPDCGSTSPGYSPPVFEIQRDDEENIPETCSCCRSPQMMQEGEYAESLCSSSNAPTPTRFRGFGCNGEDVVYRILQREYDDESLAYRHAVLSRGKSLRCGFGKEDEEKLGKYFWTVLNGVDE